MFGGSDKSDTKTDLANLTLYAGFVDIHNHGAVGVDVNTATAEGLREVSIRREILLLILEGEIRRPNLEN